MTNCEDGGVLGGVTGLVGTMQALEAVKILARVGEDTPPMLTLVSPMTGTPFRCVKIRPRRVATCRSCGDPAQVGKSMITDLESEDYISFCGLNTSLGSEAGLPRTAVSAMQAKSLIVDVRPTVEFAITKLDGSLNIPIQTLLKNPGEAWSKIQDTRRATSAKSVLVVCKKGNDSQLAVRALLDHQRKVDQQGTKEEKQTHPLEASGAVSGSAKTEQPIEGMQLSDLVGGLRAYSREKDPNFPVY